MIVGITGQIGSGKSFVGNYLKELGYAVFDCDKMVEEAYDVSKIKKKIIETFSLSNADKIDKNELKAKLDDKTLPILESIIYPYVFNKIITCRTVNFNRLVFIEVPLLFEKGIDKMLDYTICIEISDELRHKQLKKRNPENYAYMCTLEKKQMTTKEKIARSDYVITNTGDDEFLFKQIRKVVDLLNK